MKSYSFVQEGSKFKDYYFNTISGMDLRKETANTIKIINKYPTPEQLMKRLISLKEECRDRGIERRLSRVISDLKYAMPMSKEDYYEFIRKRLSGASGFWKHLLYCMLEPFLLPRLYKIFAVDHSVVKDDADDVIKKHAQGKLLFRG